MPDSGVVGGMLLYVMQVENQTLREDLAWRKLEPAFVRLTSNLRFERINAGN